jgi:hypothetical protein
MDIPPFVYLERPKVYKTCNLCIYFCFFFFFFFLGGGGVVLGDISSFFLCGAGAGAGQLVLEDISVRLWHYFTLY